MTKIDHMMIIVEMDDGYLVVSYNIFSTFICLQTYKYISIIKTSCMMHTELDMRITKNEA